MDINKRVQDLFTMKEEYYKGVPVVSDEEFDKLEDELYKADPKNEYFKKIGSSTDEIEDGEKVIHKTPMKSMQKVKNVEDAIKWGERIYDKYGKGCMREFFVEPKVDGMSCTLKYDSNGDIEYAATRGTGELGFKIEHIKTMIDYNIIPGKIDIDFIRNEINGYDGKGIEIRGEIYVPKNQLPNESSISLRNIAVGIIRRKHSSVELKHIRFVAYKILTSDILFHRSECEIILDKLGFDQTDVSCLTIQHLKENYEHYLKQRYYGYPYETDGLVLTIPDVTIYHKVDDKDKKYHWYQMALKPPSLGEMTVVTNIKWNLSRLGKLIPVAIVETINVGGVNISNVTLNNASYVETRNIHSGTKVKVIRSNDVIPMITDVINDTNEITQLPNKCPICESVVTRFAVDLYCSNVRCKGRLVSEIDFFLQNIDCKGISEKTIETVVYNEIYPCDGVINFCDIFLDINKLHKIITGDKRVLNFYNALRKSFDSSITEVKILKSLGIPTLGERMLKKLNIDSFEKFDRVYSNLENDEGFDKNINYVIWTTIYDWFKNQDNIDKYLMYRDYFQKYCKVEEIEVYDINSLKVCMTGKDPFLTRNEIEKLIKKNSHKPVSTVNKETNILIMCDDIVSNKSLSADKYGVRKMKLEEYIREF